MLAWEVVESSEGRCNFIQCGVQIYCLKKRWTSGRVGAVVGIELEWDEPQNVREHGILNIFLGPPSDGKIDGGSDMTECEEEREGRKA